MEYYKKMKFKAVAGITIVLVIVCVNSCSSDAINTLESHSVFYGLALTATNRNTPKSICEKQLAILEKGVRDLDRWAIKMMDASGGPTSGLYWGNTYWMGSKKQCVASVSTKQIGVSALAGPVTMETPDAIPPFPVDYYAAYFNHNSTMQVFIHWRNDALITLGLCIPTSCQESEVKSLLQEYFDSGVLYHQLLYKTSFQLEGVKKVFVDYSWLNSTGFMISGGLVGALLVLCLIGTVYDSLIYQPMPETQNRGISSDNMFRDINKNGLEQSDLERRKQRNGKSIKIVELPKWGKFLQCFSISNNVKEILCWNDTKEDTLMPIHGLKCFTTTYVLMTHGILFMGDQVDNRVSMYYIADTAMVQTFANSHFCVDTFYTISGFLLSYSFLKNINKKSNSGLVETSLINNSISLLRRTTKRYLRLTPAYVTAICIAYINATWRYRETAFWSEEKHDVNCANYWWRNLLYINNLFTKKEICMLWSWYLSSDMQYFVLFTALLLLSTSRFKLTASILGGIFAASSLYISYIVYSTDFKPFIDMFYYMFETIYYSPLVRVGPYIIGVVSGYLVHLYKGKLPITKDTVRLLWIVAVTFILVMLFGFADRNLSLPMSMIYMAFNRSVWSLGFAWMIIACVTNNGGTFQELLSFKCWVPFSNISYCSYLINPIIIYAVVTMNEQPWQLEVAITVTLGLAFIVLSYIGGFILAVIVEYPFNKLIKTFTNL